MTSRMKGQKRKTAPLQEPTGGDNLDDLPIDMADWHEEERYKDELEPQGRGTEPKMEGQTENSAQEPAPAAKKKKRKTNSRDEGIEKMPNIAKASKAAQVDRLWTSYSATLGATDLEKQGFDETSMADLDGSLGLEAQLFSFSKVWKNKLRDNFGEPVGSPLVICIAGSAVFANNIIKHLPSINKACKVAKLFAKHFKIEEQQEMLQKHVNVATGTPNRLDKLAETGSLKFDRLQLVVLDVAKDAKQRTLLEIPEVCGDLWKFFRKNLQQSLAEGSCKLALLNSAEVKESKFGASGVKT